MPLTAEQCKYIVSSDKVCCKTFVKEKDLPAGQKLLRCSKCLETCYVDREAQIADWKNHKQTCRLLEDDDAIVRQGSGFASAQECVQMIQSLLASPLEKIRGRTLLYAFQQLLAFANSGCMLPPGASDSCLEDYALCSRKLFQDVFDSLKASLTPESRVATLSQIAFESFDLDYPSDMLEPGQGKKTAERILSIPGLANFILSEDRFISPAMKQWKEQGIPPPPEEEFDVIESLIPSSVPDGSCKIPLASYTLLDKFLRRCVFAIGEAKVGVQSENEDIRLVNLKSTAFGAAVERLIMSVWLCPYHRMSLPMESVENFSTSRYRLIEIAIRGNLRVATNATGKFYDSTRMALSARNWKTDTEILSGITVKQLFRIMLDDEQFIHTADPGNILAVLHALDTEYSKTNSSKKAPWKFFTFQDRIDLLDFSHSQNFVDMRVILSNSEYNSEYVSVLEYWRSAVIGFSAKTVFQVYEALNDPTRNGQARPATIRSIQEKREGFLWMCRPSVHAYLHVIEPVYLGRQARSKEPALPFPDELVDHIAAFLCKARCSNYDIPYVLK